MKRSLRDFEKLDTYDSQANAVVTLLEETFSDNSKGYSVNITQDEDDVTLDFCSRKKAETFFLTLMEDKV